MAPPLKHYQHQLLVHWITESMPRKLLTSYNSVVVSNIVFVVKSKKKKNSDSKVVRTFQVFASTDQVFDYLPLFFALKTFFSIEIE